MKYLLWRNQVRLLAEKRGVDNWDYMATWRNLFLEDLTPDQALTKAQLDN